MVLVDNLDSVELPSVEGIGISVLVSYSQVERFLWVPAQRRALVHKDSLLQCRLSSHIVEVDASVHRRARNQVCLHVVELHFGHGVDTLE